MFKASSAIFVITADVIKKMGATSIPEALRVAPGVQVQRVNAYGYQVTIRGFNGLFGNKLLVMVDGRTVYTPSFSGVHWDMLDVIDIAQIEVIRGPGATLWGANAVNGIINIITKPSADTLGGNLNLGAGNNESQASLRYGWNLSDNVTARIYTKYKEYQEFEKTKTADIDDSWRMKQSGLRLDWQMDDSQSLTLQGDFFKSGFGNLGTSGFDNRERSGENIVLSYTKNHDDGASTSAKLFYNAYENREGGAFTGFTEDLETVDFDIQHRWTMGNHEVTVGGGYRSTSAQYDDVFSALPVVGISPIIVLGSGVYEFSNVYVQDKITVLEDTFYVTPGLKAEYNNFTHFEVMPSLRAVYTPDDKQTLWASVSRAVRTPSFFENSSSIFIKNSEDLFKSNFYSGNNQVESEELTAYELGYRVKPIENLVLDIATFYYDYDDARSYDEVDPFKFGKASNEAKSEVYGGEVSLKWIAREDLIIQASYSYARMKIELPSGSKSLDNDNNLPEHMASLRASYSLTQKLSLNGTLYYTGNNQDSAISASTRVDLGLVYQATDGVELSIHGKNLTDSYSEESGDEFANNAQQIRRSVFVNCSFN
ncbi:MAG: TonB-dependent receptor, partial [Lentisphaeraceae bacterium]|nr:TonB-dependent receptor [Lentisphaeraceae bacterium]